LKKLFTGMRESDRPLVTLEQFHAKILFERRDPRRDSGLRRVQLLRSRSKAAQARDPDEGFNEAQVQED